MRVILGFIAIVILSACDASIHNYVAGVHPTPSLPEGKLPPQPNGPSRLYLGPGAVRSTASGLSMNAAVNSEQRRVAVGADQSARVWLNWTRASF